ncbi:MAG: putative FmdB family regulatory protein [Candidatus Poriferisodalaceae bacterium]|jgi:putative FmdB family regulatory protein
MPNYEYRCTRCESRFQAKQSFADDALTTCPLTGGPPECQAPGVGEVNKVFGAVGITFKGSGFYKTDSRSGASSSSSAGVAPGSSSSSSSGTSTEGSSSSSSSDSSSSPASTASSTSSDSSSKKSESSSSSKD